MLTPHWYRTCNHALVWLNAEVLNGWTYSNQCESPLSTKRLIPSSLDAALVIWRCPYRLPSVAGKAHADPL